MHPPAPESWLSLTFDYWIPRPQRQLAGEIDQAAALAGRMGRRIDTSGRDPRQRLWSALSSIDPALPELAHALERASVSNLGGWTASTPQPMYHQVGLLVGAILFPRVAVTLNITWDHVRTEPPLLDEAEVLVIHPEHHVLNTDGSLAFKIDTRISLQTKTRTLCELFDECDPSSTHSGRRRADHLDRRRRLAAREIHPHSTDDAWLGRLTERWQFLFAELIEQRSG